MTAGLREIFLSLKLAATFQPESTISSPLSCTVSVIEKTGKGSFQNISGDWQESDFHPSVHTVRGELAIAKFGQYKQIKSGNCSVLT